MRTKQGLEVPAALRSVLLVGLSIDPGERHADMHVLVRKLLELTKPRTSDLLPGREQPARRGRS